MTPPSAVPKPSPAIPTDIAETNISVDVERGVVFLTQRQRLAIRPEQVVLPFAAVKMMAAQVLMAEVQGQEAGRQLVGPPLANASGREKA